MHLVLLSKGGGLVCVGLCGVGFGGLGLVVCLAGGRCGFGRWIALVGCTLVATSWGAGVGVQFR